MVAPTLPLPGLSPVAGKAVVARFDGGLLVLREIEHRLRAAERLAACLDDPREPDRSVHTLADIIHFRLLMIAAGYEDGNDATRQRTDRLFKLALERLPAARDLCSQSTISRLENLPDRRALPRKGRAMVDLYCASFRRVPEHIVLDVDDAFDAVHGAQQRRLFNAHYDGYGFQPIKTALGRPVLMLRDGVTKARYQGASRTSCSTARAASSPRCCARPSGRTAARSGPCCAA